MGISIAVKALQLAAKKAPGLSREEIVARVPRDMRFDAAALFLQAVSDGRLVEVGGRFYVPSATAAIAALKSHASA